jgi:hypothetical protein
MVQHSAVTVPLYTYQDILPPQPLRTFEEFGHDLTYVIPTPARGYLAGIHELRWILDSGFHRSDENSDFFARSESSLRRSTAPTKNRLETGSTRNGRDCLGTRRLQRVPISNLQSLCARASPGQIFTGRVRSNAVTKIQIVLEAITFDNQISKKGGEKNEDQKAMLRCRDISVGGNIAPSFWSATRGGTKEVLLEGANRVPPKHFFTLRRIDSRP